MIVVPPVGRAVPRTGNALTRTLSRLALGVIGWRIEGALPDLPKMMVIVAPHTSNWDFVVGVLVKGALGIRATFLGKDTLFRGPLGVLMRHLGGIPVYRHAPRQVVDQTVAMVAAMERVVLVLSPEGTRRKLPSWRSGFHYVARGAGLPIVPAAIDYSTRTVRFLPVHQPRETVEADLASLTPLFRAEMAYHPEQY